MYPNFIKLIILFFLTFPLFAQNEGSRPQGFIVEEPIWRQALGGTVISIPSVQVQSAVVALDGGNIRAYSTSGTSMWNFSARGRISPFVTRSREGTSYFARTNGTFIAVNRVGRELWRRSLGGPLVAKVVPGWDGRLFVPSDKKLSCFTASGNLLWSRIFESPISVGPRLDRDGGVILALESGEVYRFDPFGNVYVWMLSGRPAFLMSIENQQILVIYEDGTLELLGRSEDWFFSAMGDTHSAVMPRLPSSPIAAASRGNSIAIVLNDGRVLLFDSSSKEITWTADSHIRELIRSGSVSAPYSGADVLFDERGIFVLSRSGATGFAPNGRRLWFMYLQNMSAIPAFGNDGVLYSGGRDWILYAYRLEDRVLDERVSLYGPIPDGNYGTGVLKAQNMPNFPISEHEIKLLLERINSELQRGRVGERELEWTSSLMAIARGRHQISHRLEALRLLGQIGSQETVPWLTNFFRRENEPVIRAEAVNAIGAIGVDPEGQAIQTFLFLIINGLSDAQVLQALASSTGALCRFSGPPLSETGVRILTLLSAGNQPPNVRRQALRELSQLR
jgi:outer membrane protein assembly factor BamB